MPAIGNGEAHGEDGQAGQQQDCATGDDRSHRVVLDDACPTAAEVLAVGRGVTATVEAQSVDATTDHSQQRGHQGDGCGHGDGDGQGTGNGKALQEVHADQQQTEQRHDHRAAGEHDRPATCAHRGGDRTVHIASRGELCSVPGDHEQRVVDADAESDHRRDGRGEVGCR